MKYLASLIALGTCAYLAFMVGYAAGLATNALLGDV